MVGKWGFLHRSIGEQIAFDTAWDRRDDGGWGTSLGAGVVLRDVVDGKSWVSMGSVSR